MSDNPSEGLFEALEKAGQQEWVVQREGKFEARAVQAVLAHFGMTHHAGALRRRCQEATGTSDLTFAWFHEAFPDFPIRLGSTVLPYQHEVKRADLRKRLDRTKLYRAYEDLAAAVPDGCPQVCTGLVFQWPGDGLLVMHDYAELMVEGYRESWTGLEVVGRPLFLDFLEDRKMRQGFLFAIDGLWSPPD